MKPFREWYQDRHACPYPAHRGEDMICVMLRVAEAMADYTDEAATEMRRALDTPSPTG